MAKRISVNQLCKSLQAEVARMVAEKLSADMSWEEGTFVQTHGDEQSRWWGGEYDVTKDGQTYTLKGGLSKMGARVTWEVDVYPASGEVMASATPIATKVGDSALPGTRLFMPRKIGALGRLEKLLPYVDDVTQEFDLPDAYGRIDDVREARAALYEVLSNTAR